MSTKKTNQTQQQIEQFTGNCCYLGLKLLAEEYQQIVDKAGRDTVGYYEFICDVVQAEASSKYQRRIEYLVKNSRLPQPLKMMAEFDFDFQPKLDRKLVMDLALLGFIERNESILLLGRSGTGKSHLAQSLALMACQGGYKTYYTTCSELIKDLNAGVYEKTLEKRMRKYINEPDWPEFLGDPISTSAILDRIFHHSVIVRIDGPSYRQHQGELLQKKYGNKKSENAQSG